MKNKVNEKTEIGEGIEELLQRLRKQKGWTYADILMKLKNKTLTEKHIKKWEIGLLYPDLDMIYELSELYQIPTAIFLEAKNNSYQRGLNSVNMIVIKWISYILNVSYRIAIVLMILLYVALFFGSLLFFSSILATVDKSKI